MGDEQMFLALGVPLLLDRALMMPVNLDSCHSSTVYCWQALFDLLQAN